MNDYSLPSSPPATIDELLARCKRLSVLPQRGTLARLHDVRVRDDRFARARASTGEAVEDRIDQLLDGQFTLSK